MSAMATLAWRYLFRRRLRAALTTTAIVFGVALVVVMGGMVPTLTASLTAGMLSSIEHVDVSLSSASRAPFDEATLDRVRAVAGVARASGRLQTFVPLPSASAPVVNGRPLSAVQLTGVDASEPNPVRPLAVIAGAPLSSAHDLLVSETLQAAGVKIGSTLVLPAASGSVAFNVVGVVADRPGGVLPVFTTLAGAREVAGAGATLSQMDVLFADGATDVKERLVSTLGAGFVAEASRSHGQLLDQVSRMAMPMQAFGVLAMVMAGFIIFITFRTVVAERKRDLGLLRALGATRSMVTRLVVFEGLTLGVMGTVIGMAVGIGLERLVVSGLSPVWRSQIGIDLIAQPPQLSTLLVALVLGVGGSVLSCLAPARQASGVSPREAMRPSSARAAGGLGRVRLGVGVAVLVLGLAGLVTGALAGQAIGVALFCVAVLVLGPAIVAPISAVFATALAVAMAQETRLAQGNVQRQRHRSAITASVMAVSLGIVVALAALTSSTIEGLVGQMDRTLKADFMVMPPTMMPGAGLGARPELAQKLSSVEGVSVVSGIRNGQTTSDGSDVSLIGIDPAAFLKVAAFDFEAGDESSLARLSQPRTLVANTIWAAAKKLKLGDRVTLTTSHGPESYEVVAIGSDGLFYRLPGAYLSHASLEQDFGLTADTLLFVSVGKGADVAAARAGMTRTLEAWPGLVLNATGEWRDRLMADGRKKMNSLYILLVLMVVPALIALANTLGINVLERIRELGLLRAIGTTRRQLGRLILAESLLLACVGGLVGVLGGVWMGLVWVRALAFQGMNVAYRVPAGGVLTAIVLALVFGAIAALVPARHAVSLKITAALRHE